MRGENLLKFGNLFESSRILYMGRKSSQIWEPFCKFKDIVYEGKIKIRPLDRK